MGRGRRIKFIYNPHSGMLHPIYIISRLIERYFPSNLCEYSIVTSQRKNHAYELAQEAVVNGYDIVVAIGGDGTVNEIASALVNTDVQFGIIPIGSGNGLARGLGIPLNPIRAVRLITTGVIRSIDVGQVRDRYFFAASGFGFDAILGKRFDQSKTRGPAPYYIAGVKEYFSYEQPEFEVQINEKVMKSRALLVAVTNVKQYGNNAIIAPNAVPDDGKLDLCFIRSMKFLPTIMHLPKLFTGQINKAPSVELYQGTKFTVRRNYPRVYILDGEVFEDSNETIDIKVLPRALNVIVTNVTF